MGHGSKNAKTAITLAQDNDHAIDLLLTNVVMPDLNGK